MQQWCVGHQILPPRAWSQTSDMVHQCQRKKVVNKTRWKTGWLQDRGPRIIFIWTCMFFSVQADWFASRFALSLPCRITYFTSSFFAALPSVGRRGMYLMEATSCHQTLTPRWRPTKPAVSRRTDAPFRRASLSHRLPPNRNGYSAFEWARRPELLDTLAFCR